MHLSSGIKMRSVKVIQFETLRIGQIIWHKFFDCPLEIISLRKIRIDDTYEHHKYKIYDVFT